MTTTTDRPAGWCPTFEYDPAPGGPLMAAYADGSGGRIFFAADDGLYDGETMEALPDGYLLDAGFGLYSWMPKAFRPWGLEHYE